MKFLGAYLWTTIGLPRPAVRLGPRPRGLAKAFEASTEADGRARPTQGEQARQAQARPHGRLLGQAGQPQARQLGRRRHPEGARPRTSIYPKEQKLIDICKKQKADGHPDLGVRPDDRQAEHPAPAQGAPGDGGAQGRHAPVGRRGPDRARGLDRRARPRVRRDDLPPASSSARGSTCSARARAGTTTRPSSSTRRATTSSPCGRPPAGAWRIGQPRDCRVYYLYYKETMQHRAMQPDEPQDGGGPGPRRRVPEDGLAAMAGEDNLQMALAKTLAERIDEADMQRSWSKVKSGPGRRRLRSRARSTTLPSRSARSASRSSTIQLPRPHAEMPGRDPLTLKCHQVQSPRA